MEKSSIFLKEDQRSDPKESIPLTVNVKSKNMHEHMKNCGDFFKMNL